MLKAKNLLLNALVVSLIAMMTFASMKLAVYSQETMASVYLNPSRFASVTWTPGKQLNLTVNVKDVSDLFAWEISLHWNASVIDFVSWTEGPYLEAQPQGTYVAEDLNQTEHPGNITIGVTTIGGYVGRNEDGILAYLTLQVKALGETVLDLYDTLLVDSTWGAGQPRPEDWIPHTATDGLFVNVGVPEPSFTFDPAKPAANATVTFDASESYDSDGTIVSYAWDFGDGSPVFTSDAPTATHSYSLVKSYSVVLNITDNKGLSNILTQSIAVRWLHDVGIVSVSADLLSVSAGQTITITVIVKNLGATAETFDVSVLHLNTEIGKQTVTGLAPDETKTLTFAWDTSGLAADDYTIRAEAKTVSGEVSVSDNMRADGTVEIKSGDQGISMPLMIGGAVGVIAVAGAAFFLLRRRNKGTPAVAASAATSGS